MACSDKKKEGEVVTRSLRRSWRLAKTKAAAASEESEILRLKREGRALMRRIAPEEVQAAAGKKRKVIKKVVPRAAIEFMVLNPHKPWDGFPEEELPNRSLEFREYYARHKASSDKFLEYQQALIKQFRKKGYAEDYTEVEVADNDEN